MALDRGAGGSARSRDRVAEPLGLSLQAAARGILAIVDNNMVGAIRVVSVERGHDPRDFTWCRSAAPARCMAARWPSCSASRACWSRRRPGVLCADGLLAADLKAEFCRTLPQPAR